MSNGVSTTEQGMTVELRPGVLRPDWSAVTSPTARDALRARGASRSSLVERWSVALNGTEDHIWRRVLALFADLGRAPSAAEIAIDTGLDRQIIEEALRHLQRRDLLRLSADARSIIDVYPFTSRATGHVIQLGARSLNVLCAIDALGTGAMYGRDVFIESRCRVCHTAIRIATADQGRSLDSISPASTVVWHDTTYQGSAAASCCPNIAFFCSDEHLHEWLNISNAHQNGRRLLPDEALQVGKAIFGPVLAEAATAPREERTHKPLTKA